MDRNRSKQIKPTRASKAAAATRAAAAVATTLLLLAVTLSSCTKEPAGGEQPLPDGAVRIVLSVGDTKSDSKNNSNSDPQTDPNSDSKTRATEDGSAAENRIANIKVLFYDHATQTLDLIKHIDDVTAPNGDETIRWESNKLIITGVTNQSKAYDIYVIANWTDGFNAADFAKDTPITNLTAAFTRIAGQIVAPDATHALLMSGSAINHIFSKSATAQVALMRQVAKIRINVQIGADFKAKYPDAVFGAAASPENSQLTVYNIPNSSYVYGTTNESRYNELMTKEGSKLLDYPTITMTPAATETVNVYETETVYVYENITLGTTAQAKEKATFMVLRLPYKLTEGANAVTKNYYKFHVQDDLDRENPHKTRRNHIYDLTATVVGFGKDVPDIGGVTITTKVLPWGYVSINESDGEYLVVDATSTLPTDGGKLANNTHFYKVTCKTNVGGWYVVAKDKDGSIIGGSVLSEGALSDFGTKAAVVTDAASQTQTLHVTIEPNYGDAERIVTLEIKHDSYRGDFNQTRTYTQKFMKLVLGSDRKADYGNPLSPTQVGTERQSGILADWDGTTYCYLVYKYGSVVGIRSYFEEYPNRQTDTYGTDDIAWEPANKTYSQIVRWVTQPAGPYTSGDIPWQAGTYIHSLANVKQGLGDPCRLVGLTQAEIKSGEIDNGTWKTPASFTVVAIKGGFNPNSKTAGIEFTDGMFLQGSGSREYSTGKIGGNQAIAGYYRFTTPVVSSRSNNMDVHAALLGQTPYAGVVEHERGDAFSIRCVRQ